MRLVAAFARGEVVMKRFLLIALLVLVVLVGGGLIYLRYYLRSPRVTHEVATRLEAMVGAPVRVENVDVGIHGSTLNGFELFEPGTDASQSTPWLKVGSLTTDISLWDIMRGQAMPKHVTLSNAQVVLRFDAQGQLVTEFPTPPEPSTSEAILPEMPEVVIEQSEVVLRKAGQPELAARDVNARLTRKQEGAYAFSGSAQSAELGKLLLDGNYDAAKHEAVATLKTAGTAHVTGPLLDRLPYVPPATWEEVQIREGDTPAELTVRYTLFGGPVRWRLAMKPTNTDLRVVLLDLPVQGAHGELVIDDALVELRQVQGKAYGGDIALDADLDFRGQDTRLSFPKITLTNLNVADVPESWNEAELRTLRKLAPNGKLTGSASVEMTVHPGELSPRTIESVIGLAATPSDSGRWLPVVAALSAFPQRVIETRSSGKATIAPVAGGSAEIELKLGPHKKAPPRKEASHVVPHRLPPALTALPLSQAVHMVEKEPPAIVPAAFVTAVATAQQPVGEGAYPAVNVELERVVGKIVGGVNALMCDVVDFGSRFVASVPRKVQPAPAKAEESTSYLDLNLKLKDVDLAQLAKSLDLKLGFPLEGRASLDVKASIPTNKAADLKTYKLTGSAQVKNLVFAGAHVTEASADIRYANGLLELTSLKGRFGAAQTGADPTAGRFRGSGKLQVAPLGDLSAELTLDRMPASEIAGLVKEPLALAGSFSGQFNLHGPVDTLNDPSVLEGSGKITANRVSAYGVTLDQASTSVELKDGVVRLPDLAGNLDGTPANGSAELRITDPYAFKARLDLKNWDLGKLETLAAKGKEPPIALAGAFTTTVDVQGTLKPFKFTASGDASTAGLKVNTFTVSNVNVHWTIDDDKLDLSKLNLQLYGGEAVGSAVLPLKPNVAGTANLKLSKLDANQMVKDLAMPVKIEGKIGGQLRGTLPPTAEGKARTATMDLDVSAPKLRVQNIPTEQLHGKLDYKEGVIDYKLEGKTLGGTFEVEGQIPSPAPVKKESRKGRLRIDNVSLSALADALNVRESVPIAGRLSVAVDFTHDTPNRLPAGKGLLRIVGLRWKEAQIAPELTGELLLNDGVLRLRELSGEIGGGLARLQLVVNLTDPERSRAILVLENVESSQLLAPWLGDKIKGPMQARIVARIGATWRGTAELELTRGEVAGMEITSWRLPVEWEYSPETQRAQVDVHETSAQIARGRFTGKLNATWDYAWRVTGNIRFSGVDLQALLRPVAGTTQVVGGQATGRFDFSGNEVRSINDLSGTLTASFSQAQALQIPVLSQLQPFLRTGPSTTFQRGALQARLDHGVLRIQQFNLEGGNLRVHMDGTVTLAGALNLNVVANTGDIGLPTLRLGAIGLRIPITGPLPITVLQEVSALLANRVIYLTVTGTVRNPVIRIQVLQMLTEEAVRFFLNRANLPIPVAP
jgi:hypothetical protein